MKPEADQTGAFVEIDGQKVHLGDGYKVGPVSMSDLLQVAQTTLLKLVKDEQAQLEDFALKLKKGDRSAIVLTTIATILAMYASYLFLSYLFRPSKDSAQEAESQPEPEPIVLRDFTIQQLREFNGEDDKPIYVGLVGDVYDVTQARNYYGPGATYHLFAGRDSSRAMAKLSFEEVDLSNPDISRINPFEKDALDDWVHKFKYYKQYPIVGRLSTPPTDLTLTRSELAQFTGTGSIPEGKVHAPVYVVLNGTVFDVSYGGYEMYGPEGPYSNFAGKDISRALAKMSFDKNDLENTDMSDLDERELKILADWEKKLRETKKYPVVGTLMKE